MICVHIVPACESLVVNEGQKALTRKLNQSITYKNKPNTNLTSYTVVCYKGKQYIYFRLSQLQATKCVWTTSTHILVNCCDICVLLCYLFLSCLFHYISWKYLCRFLNYKIFSNFCLSGTFRFTTYSSIRFI